MYWIYLIIFTFIALVPTIFHNHAWGRAIPGIEGYTILFLGTIGFVIFLVQEKKLKKNHAEKTQIQTQVNRMTKDLTHSYSYIGEINRKLDILENIALAYPESSNITERKQSEIYDSIMGAIGLFGKSDDFALQFICLPDQSIVKEIKSHPKLTFNFTNKDLKSTSNFLETKEFIVISSPKAIDNVFSRIVIRKKTSTHRIDDHEMMKTLAAQALFLYMFMHHKKKMHCII